jgi:hypothetical protein
MARKTVCPGSQQNLPPLNEQAIFNRKEIGLDIA